MRKIYEKPLSQYRHDTTRRYLKALMKEADGRVAVAAQMAGRNRTDMYKILHRFGYKFNAHYGKWGREIPEEWLDK